MAAPFTVQHSTTPTLLTNTITYYLRKKEKVGPKESEHLYSGGDTELCIMLCYLDRFFALIDFT